ncbi:hypothetical protein BDP55DRAFT_653664 [Colletotrichum godetiae]|uniref:Uncharacterized protein n=1 Tax=Colletotrichum godetiae TaxID=1209918 RepID=A0AAJ0ASM5_9PEZI|nr:uncharacterized protein BDP55DRAFT_653664 [Colletotrichum godetiae]KAK1689632.1 hypothetical protein BDP55DRAFT_653664 [Colletotrichum godetiae]
MLGPPATFRSCRCPKARARTPVIGTKPCPIPATDPEETVECRAIHRKGIAEFGNFSVIVRKTAAYERCYCSGP